METTVTTRDPKIWERVQTGKGVHWQCLVCIGRGVKHTHNLRRHERSEKHAVWLKFRQYQHASKRPQAPDTVNEVEPKDDEPTAMTRSSTQHIVPSPPSCSSSRKRARSRSTSPSTRPPEIAAGAAEGSNWAALEYQDAMNRNSALASEEATSIHQSFIDPRSDGSGQPSHRLEPEAFLQSVTSNGMVVPNELPPAHTTGANIDEVHPEDDGCFMAMRRSSTQQILPSSASFPPSRKRVRLDPRTISPTIPPETAATTTDGINWVALEYQDATRHNSTVALTTEEGPSIYAVPRVTDSRGYESRQPSSQLELETFLPNDTLNGMHARSGPPPHHIESNYNNIEGNGELFMAMGRNSVHRIHPPPAPFSYSQKSAHPRSIPPPQTVEEINWSTLEYQNTMQHTFTAVPAAEAEPNIYSTLRVTDSRDDGNWQSSNQAFLSNNAVNLNTMYAQYQAY